MSKLFEIFGSAFGRVTGVMFLYGLTTVALVFTAATIIGSVIGDRTDDVGFDRLLCVVGIEVGSEPCPQMQRVAVDARQAAEAARQEALVARRVADAAQRDADAARAEQERLAQLDARSDSYTLFSNETPRELPGYEVVAGTVYESMLESSEPTRRYCYIDRRGSGGVHERLDIVANGSPQSASASQLSAMGLTAEDFVLARQFCRYTD